MGKLLISRALPVLYLLLLCPLALAARVEKADSIYYGGNIITLNSRQPSVAAVAVRGGKIIALGSRRSLQKHQHRETDWVNLRGRTLLPGFVDGHSHFAQVGLQAISANLLPPPDGPGTSIAKLQDIMRQYAAQPAVIPGLLIGYDYDDSQLTERRHPTRQELDAVSPANTAMLFLHQSGHLGVYNSYALRLLNITLAGPVPGGMVYPEADGTTPNGLLSEEAHIGAVTALLGPKLTNPALIGKMMAAAQKIYLQYGYTTAQDGRADPGTLAMLQALADSGKLKIDLVAYPDLVLNATSPVLQKIGGSYVNHLRYGGVKLTLDGSPQGKTAWFTQPYFVPPDGAAADYRGIPIFAGADESKAQSLVNRAYQNHWQIMMHANGDAAIDQMIRLVGQARSQFPGNNRRTVLIHGQYLRADQIPVLKQLEIMPSLYPMHTFYWGDWHRESVAGPERAEFISPTGAVLRAGMKLSIHSDAPVTFPNSMRVLDSAVNRTTRSGYVLGAEQRLTPLQALKAMTIWPAWQHFEESNKGTIALGKAADFVVLSADPLTVAAQQLVDIKVLETIKGGVSIYQAETVD
jgi:predicted amidohydrolase YtcJ